MELIVTVVILVIGAVITITLNHPALKHHMQRGIRQRALGGGHKAVGH